MADTDDDNYRPSKRTRAAPASRRNNDDDADAMQSSPGRSQHGHSREDVPTTDQTDDEPFEVFTFLIYLFSLVSTFVLCLSCSRLFGSDE